MPPSALPSQLERRRGLVLLAAIVTLVYAPSLSGDFLNWDDPWLVVDNGLLRRGVSGIATIWLDLSRHTRMILGGEYLPVRDLSWWVEEKIHQLNPHALRVSNLSFYVASIAFFAVFLRRLMGPRPATYLAVVVFALHPAHVEVVAWISSRKDLLAMLATALAIAEYSRRTCRSTVVACAAFMAVFSKSAAVVLPALLLLIDYRLARRPRWTPVALAFAISSAAAIVHVVVGSTVGMIQSPAGGSRYTAVMNASASLLSYVKLTLWPPALALIHDPAPISHWTPPAVAGAVVLLATGLYCWREHAAGDREPAFCLGWFLFPLAPVLGVAFPLQNLLADRYLAIALLGPCILFGRMLTDLLRWRAGVAFVIAVLCTLAASSAHRAWLFGASVRVMAESTVRSPESRRAAYQYARALEKEQRLDEAVAQYRESMHRPVGMSEPAVRGALAIARIEVDRGRRTEAARVLKEALTQFPNERRLRRRLAAVDQGAARASSPTDD